jgi:hypothetical protein
MTSIKVMQLARHNRMNVLLDGKGSDEIMLSDISQLLPLCLSKELQVWRVYKNV